MRRKQESETPMNDAPGTAGRPGYVRVRGAREHNLKNVNVELPRDALVVFTGVSGSGKSSLAFGTLYAEAQRRYLESVSPYARRLFHQMPVPEVDEIDGLPPAVALQQQRGTPTVRSSVGSVSTLSNSIRMLYSRAGDYPPGQPLLYAESFSTNTAEGACPQCSGLGRVYEVTEQSMVLAVPGRRPGTARTCATSSSRWATTSTRPGATCRRRTATGSCSPTRRPPCPCMRA
jgi:excinuclease ABC subunit A